MLSRSSSLFRALALAPSSRIAYSPRFVSTTPLLYRMLEQDASQNPIEQFEKWHKEAKSSDRSYEETHGCVLSTCSHDRPSARMMALKEVSKDGFVFFGDVTSRKGYEMHENPHAALVFYWPWLHRQVRIEGTVEKVSDSDADEAWNKRRVDNRISDAIPRQQGEKVESREVKELEKEREKLKEKADSEGDKAIKRPDAWKGFRVKSEYIVFWQGRSNGIHDRLEYTLEGQNWTRNRLAP